VKSTLAWSASNRPHDRDVWKEIELGGPCRRGPYLPSMTSDLPMPALVATPRKEFGEAGGWNRRCSIMRTELTVADGMRFMVPVRLRISPDAGGAGTTGRAQEQRHSVVRVGKRDEVVTGTVILPPNSLPLR